MAEADLGVSSRHEELIISFLRFSRLRRAQCAKAVEASFKELCESRLVDDTYTAEEVREMLTGLGGLVRAEVESELINTAHTNVLLLRQLLKKAEKYHLELQAQISELEDGELLKKVARFEQKDLNTGPQHTLSSSDASSLRARQLEPLGNAAGGERLLQIEIKRMEEENRELSRRIRSLEAKASSALTERDRLMEQLVAKSQSPAVAASSEEEKEEVAMLRKQVSELQAALNEAQVTSSDSASSMKEELTHTTHELLRVRAEQEKTMAELEKKFSETVQYKNMRKMLSTKNDQISELRAKLSDKCTHCGN